MLYSEPYLRKRIEEEKFRTCRTDSPFTLVLFNPFMLLSKDGNSAPKAINLITKVMAQETRQTDIQGWWNRKTLAILLPDTPPEGGITLIRKLVSNMNSNGYKFAQAPDKTLFQMYSFPNSKQIKSHTEENSKDKNRKKPGGNGPNQAFPDVHTPPNQIDSEYLSLNGSKKHYKIMKYVMDLLFSALLLLILSPLLLLCAVIIKLDSPGPVIYRQTRVGKGGRHFVFYKFRTMHQNADETVHESHIRNLVNHMTGLSGTGRSKENTYKIIDDDRVTRFGRFLRRTSLDELPQLLNILKGDMSLVGPRPHPLYEAGLYNPWYTYRLDVKPGITGLGQIDGRYNREYEDVYRLDLQYAKKASLLLDLKILLKTPLVVLSSRGAL